MIEIVFREKKMSEKVKGDGWLMPSIFICSLWPFDFDRVMTHLRESQNAVNGRIGAKTGTNNMVDTAAVETFSQQLAQRLPLLGKHLPDQEKHISKSIDMCSPFTPCSSIEISAVLILFSFNISHFLSSSPFFMFSIFSLQSCCHVFVLSYHSASTKANSVKLCCRLQVIASLL